jgi:hypothetical protein
VQHHLPDQQVAQGRLVAGAGGAEEGAGDAVGLGAADGLAGGCLAQARPGAGGKLAAGRFAAAEEGGDLGEGRLEQVVQDEDRALGRGEALEGEQEGDGQRSWARSWAACWGGSSDSRTGSGSQGPT